MNIEHIAIWTNNLEVLKEFYITFFGAEASSQYINPTRKLESCFLTFEHGARLELMFIPELTSGIKVPSTINLTGYAHLAFSVGSKDNVNKLTATLMAFGSPVLEGPRHTGDGYYESSILDPDGNRIEITV